MSGLRHQAVLYEGVDEFLSVTVPFVRDGVTAGDPVIAVAPQRNLDALREALGSDAQGADLRYSHEWYLSPAASFGGFIGFTSANEGAS